MESMENEESAVPISPQILVVILLFDGNMLNKLFCREVLFVLAITRGTIMVLLGKFVILATQYYDCSGWNSPAL